MNLPQAYVKSGLALVPIPRGTKGPVTAGWNEPGQAVTDIDAASRLDGNVGIAHAYSTPRTAAIDVDDLAGATVWLAGHGIDLAALINATDAVWIDSGRPNRAKLLYRLHDDMPAIPSKVIKEGSKTILEFRCATAEGKTVQDVLPPSIHPDTGKPYQWAGRGHWDKLPALPLKVAALWQSMLSPKSATPQGLAELGPRPARLDAKPLSPTLMILAGAPHETPDEITKIQAWLDLIPAACSRDQWRNTVWAVHDLQWACAEDLARQWSMTAPAQFDADAFDLVWRTFKPGGGITWRSLPYIAVQAGAGSMGLPTLPALPAASPALPASPAPPAWVAELNARFAEVRVGTQVLVLDERTPIETPAGIRYTAGYLDIAAFRQMHNGRTALAAGQRSQPLANAWLAHPDRRQYQGSVFEPGRATPAGILNLWVGFAVEPVAGDMTPWLRVLACVVPDPATQRYVLRWLARKVQHPGEVPGTILLVMGGKGTGKNSLFEPVVRIFGSHGRVFDDAEQIAGRFTGHLQTVAFAVLDEALFTGNSLQADRIKSRITATSMTFEAKGRDPVQGVNRCAYVSLSNHAHVWQATIDERRAVVIEAGTGLVNDRAFWSGYYAWLNGTGPAALLHHLQSLDVQDFDPRAIPKGEALRRQIEQTALRDPAAAWWHGILSEGVIGARFGTIIGTVLSVDTSTDVSKAELQDSFKSANPRAHAGDWAAAMRKLRGWVGPAGIPERRTRQGESRARNLVLPSLTALRQAFEQATGIRIDDDTDG